MFEPLSIVLLDDKTFAFELSSKRKKLDANYKYHLACMLYSSHGDIDISQNCYLSPIDPNFELPSKQELNKVVNHILSIGYSKQEISNYLGVQAERNRTLNYWLSESSAKSINKSNWILLCQLAGLQLVTALPNLNNKRKVRFE
ncbi:hypothetical protein [Photobacterium damselae]|uniref:hypothetical protein n=1 Tax=Photobacterium damselae TaxID=38293 RepID=UPI000A2F9EB4|nr:hypothetical protein [Photobacterium damselae]ARR51938.1 hypothetical protein CAY62_21300 [Photobacterium damselae subsp. damselae]